MHQLSKCISKIYLALHAPQNLRGSTIILFNCGFQLKSEWINLSMRQTKLEHYGEKQIMYKLSKFLSPQYKVAGMTNKVWKEIN